MGVLIVGGAFATAGLWLLFGLVRTPALPLHLGRSDAAAVDAALVAPRIAKGAPQTWTFTAAGRVEDQLGEVQDAFTSTLPSPRGGRLRVLLQHGGSDAIAVSAAGLPGAYPRRRAAAGALRCPPRSAAAAARASKIPMPQSSPSSTGMDGDRRSDCRHLARRILRRTARHRHKRAAGSFLKRHQLRDSADGPWFFVGMIGGIACGIALAWRLLLRPDER